MAALSGPSIQPLSRSLLPVNFAVNCLETNYVVLFAVN